MVSFNLKVLAKFGLCSNCSQKSNGCSLARLLACSCSQNFCSCLSNARARKNKLSAHMLADARKDHSIPSNALTIRMLCMNNYVKLLVA